MILTSCVHVRGPCKTIEDRNIEDRSIEDRSIEDRRGELFFSREELVVVLLF